VEVSALLDETEAARPACAGTSQSKLCHLADDHSKNTIRLRALVPQRFEKDDDSNGHVDYVTATSSLRAVMYGLTPYDRLQTKKVAGDVFSSFFLWILLCVFENLLLCLLKAETTTWKKFLYFTGLPRSLKKYGKIWSISALEKNSFGLLVWKKKIIFQTWFFDMDFHNILFKIDNFTFIVLTIIVSFFHLGMSFEKRKPGKSPEKVLKNYGSLHSKFCRNLVKVQTISVKSFWTKKFDATPRIATVHTPSRQTVSFVPFQATSSRPYPPPRPSSPASPRCNCCRSWNIRRPVTKASRNSATPSSTAASPSSCSASPPQRSERRSREDRAMLRTFRQLLVKW